MKIFTGEVEGEHGHLAPCIRYWDTCTDLPILKISVIKLDLVFH